MPGSRIDIPLSRAERQAIQAAVRAIADLGPEGVPIGPELAARLDAEWELDPTTRVLVLQLEGIALELRSLRTTVFVAGALIVLLSLGIVGGLVGQYITATLPGGAGVSVQPAASEARAIPPDMLDTAPGAPVPTL